MKKIIRDEVTNLLQQIPLAKNLARKKFIAAFLLGLLDSRKVQFQEIALHIESCAKLSSIERTIQSFFKLFQFDYQKVCALLVLFLPRGPVCLSIDRTEWDFGVYQCNILMIVARQEGFAIPLYWSLLDNKSGNSNSQHRIDLLQNVLSVLGLERVEMIVGDREFIGLKWIKYLKDNNIPFCLRVPKSHLITLKNGNTYSIACLLENSTQRYFESCLVDGVCLNCSLTHLKPNEYLFLIGSVRAKKLGNIYRKRWCIETLFQTFKRRGFDLESTHLKSSEKLSKLLVFVSIAVAICSKAGQHYHQKVKVIKTKKHGYKATSFFRKGATLIRRGLKHTTQTFVDWWVDRVATLARWIRIQLTYNQNLKKIFG